MQDTMKMQKEQMEEDTKWLKKEEKLLVRRKTFLTISYVWKYRSVFNICYNTHCMLTALSQDPMVHEDTNIPEVCTFFNF